MLGDVFMPNLKDAPRNEVAQRMRQLAAGLTDSTDIAVVRAYAEELQRVAEMDRRAARIRKQH
jgi:hypothetical protein